MILNRPKRLHTPMTRRTSTSMAMSTWISLSRGAQNTPIYVKMDAKEQLLSEGICRQLGIIQYHKEVTPGQGGGVKESSVGDDVGGEVRVPTVRVTLVQSIKLRPEESAVVEVKLVGNGAVGGGVCGARYTIVSQEAMG